MATAPPDGIVALSAPGRARRESLTRRLGTERARRQRSAAIMAHHRRARFAFAMLVATTGGALHAQARLGSERRDIANLHRRHLVRVDVARATFETGRRAGRDRDRRDRAHHADRFATRVWMLGHDHSPLLRVLAPVRDSAKFHAGVLGTGKYLLPIVWRGLHRRAVVALAGPTRRRTRLRSRTPCESRYSRGRVSRHRPRASARHAGPIRDIHSRLGRLAGSLVLQRAHRELDGVRVVPEPSILVRNRRSSSVCILRGDRRRAHGGRRALDVGHGVRRGRRLCDWARDRRTPTRANHHRARQRCDSITGSTQSTRAPLVLELSVLITPLLTLGAIVLAHCSARVCTGSTAAARRAGT